MSSTAPSAAPSPRLDQIINATRVLFGRYGYRRTAMDDIAREAGLAKATLYLHFSGKEDVFRAMLARCREVMAQRSDAAERLDAPVAERLVALLDANFGAALEWFGDASHLGELRALVKADAPEHLTESETAFRERLRRVLEAAARAGELDLTSAGLSTDQVLGVLLNAAGGAKHARPHSAESYREALRDIVAVTVRALAPT